MTTPAVGRYNFETNIEQVRLVIEQNLAALQADLSKGIKPSGTSDEFLRGLNSAITSTAENGTRKLQDLARAFEKAQEASRGTNKPVTNPGGQPFNAQAIGLQQQTVREIADKARQVLGSIPDELSRSEPEIRQIVGQSMRAVAETLGRVIYDARQEVIAGAQRARQSPQQVQAQVGPTPPGGGVRPLGPDDRNLRVPYVGIPSNTPPPAAPRPAAPAAPARDEAARATAQAARNAASESLLMRSTETAIRREAAVQKTEETARTARTAAAISETATAEAKSRLGKREAAAILARSADAAKVPASALSAHLSELTHTSQPGTDIARALAAQPALSTIVKARAVEPAPTPPPAPAPIPPAPAAPTLAQLQARLAQLESFKVPSAPLSKANLGENQQQGFKPAVEAINQLLSRPVRPVQQGFDLLSRNPNPVTSEQANLASRQNLRSAIDNEIAMIRSVIATEQASTPTALALTAAKQLYARAAEQGAADTTRSNADDVAASRTFADALRARAQSLTRSTTKEEPAKAQSERFLHGGLPSGTSIKDIDLNRVGSQQNKRGRDFGGFYMTGQSSRSWAESYAAGRNGNLHEFELKPDARIHDVDPAKGNIDRLSAAERAEYAKNYDLLRGKDALGREQAVLLNRDAVANITEHKVPLSEAGQRKAAQAAAAAKAAENKPEPAAATPPPPTKPPTPPPAAAAPPPEEPRKGPIQARLDEAKANPAPVVNTNQARATAQARLAAEQKLAAQTTASAEAARLSQITGARHSEQQVVAQDARTAAERAGGRLVTDLDQRQQAVYDRLFSVIERRVTNEEARLRQSQIEKDIESRQNGTRAISTRFAQQGEDFFNRKTGTQVTDPTQINNLRDAAARLDTRGDRTAASAAQKRLDSRQQSAQERQVNQLETQIRADTATALGRNFAERNGVLLSRLTGEQLTRQQDITDATAALGKIQDRKLANEIAAQRQVAPTLARTAIAGQLDPAQRFNARGEQSATGDLARINGQLYDLRRGELLDARRSADAEAMIAKSAQDLALVEKQRVAAAELAQRVADRQAVRLPNNLAAVNGQILDRRTGGVVDPASARGISGQAALRDAMARAETAAYTEKDRRDKATQTEKEREDLRKAAQARRTAREDADRAARQKEAGERASAREVLRQDLANRAATSLPGGVVVRNTGEVLDRYNGQALDPASKRAQAAQEALQNRIGKQQEEAQRVNAARNQLAGAPRFTASGAPNADGRYAQVGSEILDTARHRLLSGQEAARLQDKINAALVEDAAALKRLAELDRQLGAGEARRTSVGAGNIVNRATREVYNPTTGLPVESPIARRSSQEAFDRGEARDARVAENASARRQAPTLGGSFLGGLTSRGFGSGTNSFDINGLAASAGTLLKYQGLNAALGLVTTSVGNLKQEYFDFIDSQTAFNAAMDKGGGVTQSYLTTLTQFSREAGTNVGEALDTATRGVAAFSDKSKDSEEQQKANGAALAQSANQLRLITGKQLGDVTGDLIAIATAYKVQADELNTINDAVTNAGKNTGGDKGQISQGLASFAVTAKEAGFGLNEAANLIGLTIAKVDESGSAAGTRLTKIFAIIGGSEGQKAIAGLNAMVSPDLKVDTTAPIRKQLEQLAAAYQNLGEQGNTAAQARLRSQLGGTAQIRELLPLLENQAQLNQFNQQSAEGAGAATEEYNKRLHDITGIVKNLSGDLKALAVDFANTGVFDAIGIAMKAAEPVLRTVDDLLQAFNATGDKTGRTIRGLVLATGELAVALRLLGVASRAGIVPLPGLLTNRTGLLSRVVGGKGGFSGGAGLLPATETVAGTAGADGAASSVLRLKTSPTETALAKSGGVQTAAIARLGAEEEKLVAAIAQLNTIQKEEAALRQSAAEALAVAQREEEAIRAAGVGDLAAANAATKAAQLEYATVVGSGQARITDARATALAASNRVDSVTPAANASARNVAKAEEVHAANLGRAQRQTEAAYQRNVASEGKFTNELAAAQRRELEVRAAGVRSVEAAATKEAGLRTVGTLGLPRLPRRSAVDAAARGEAAAAQNVTQAAARLQSFKTEGPAAAAALTAAREREALATQSAAQARARATTAKAATDKLPSPLAVPAAGTEAAKAARIASAQANATLVAAERELQAAKAETAAAYKRVSVIRHAEEGGLKVETKLTNELALAEENLARAKSQVAAASTKEAAANEGSAAAGAAKGGRFTTVQRGAASSGLLGGIALGGIAAILIAQSLKSAADKVDKGADKANNAAGANAKGDVDAIRQAASDSKSAAAEARASSAGLTGFIANNVFGNNATGKASDNAKDTADRLNKVADQLAKVRDERVKNAKGTDLADQYDLSNLDAFKNSVDAISRTNATAKEQFDALNLAIKNAGLAANAGKPIGLNAGQSQDYGIKIGANIVGVLKEQQASASEQGDKIPFSKNSKERAAETLGKTNFDDVQNSVNQAVKDFTAAHGGKLPADKESRAQLAKIIKDILESKIPGLKDIDEAVKGGIDIGVTTSVNDTYTDLDPDALKTKVDKEKGENEAARSKIFSVTTGINPLGGDTRKGAADAKASYEKALKQYGPDDQRTKDAKAISDAATATVDSITTQHKGELDALDAKDKAGADALTQETVNETIAKQQPNLEFNATRAGLATSLGGKDPKNADRSAELDAATNKRDSLQEEFNTLRAANPTANLEQLQAQIDQANLDVQNATIGRLQSLQALAESAISPFDKAGRIQSKLDELKAELEVETDPAKRRAIEAAINSQEDAKKAQAVSDKTSANSLANFDQGSLGDAQTEVDNSYIELKAITDTGVHSGEAYNAAMLKYKKMLKAQVDLQNQTNQIMGDLKIDLTDPVAVAKKALDDANQALADNAGKDDGTLAPLRKAQVQAQAGFDAAAETQKISDLQTDEKLRRISHADYIAGLQNERRRVAERLAGLKEGDQEYRQYKDQLNNIDGLLQDAKGSLSGQFNVGDVKLPTIFQVRTYIKKRSDAIKNPLDQAEALLDQQLGKTTNPVLKHSAALQLGADGINTTKAVSQLQLLQQAIDGLVTGGPITSTTGRDTTYDGNAQLLFNSNPSGSGGVNITINGGDLGQVKQILAQYLGAQTIQANSAATASKY